VGALAMGIVAAFTLPFLFLWATARSRQLREDVAAIVGRVDALEAASPSGTTASLRPALFAVRSEFGSCERQMTEAVERQAWWDPRVDPLPADKWSEHLASLSNPALPSSLVARIEDGYQKCHQLNRRVDRYIREYRNTHFPLPMLPTSVFAFREGDGDVLEEVREDIRVAILAISDELETS
jgi:hypothetical protein